MSATGTIQWPLLRRMVEELKEALGGQLKSLVLYGSAARGDYHEGTSDFNLVLVAERLDPATLEALSLPVARWRRKGQPPPRLLTEALIRESLDVYPIEFLDIRTHHVVLQGSDPFTGLRVRADQLRLQCERELREKVMRLREGYVEAHASKENLRRLLVDSYSTFVALFRGCLHLVGTPPPARNGDVAAAFCARAGIDPAPFEAVDRMRHGGGPAGVDLKTLFSGYYGALQTAVGAVDHFRPGDGGETR